MHPARKLARNRPRQDTPEAFQATLGRFYSDHSGDATPWTYSVVAMSTNEPPNFDFSEGWEELKDDPRFSALQELPQPVREFYSLAAVDVLLTEVQMEYKALQKEYVNVIRRAVECVFRYCRVKNTVELGLGGEVGLGLQHARASLAHACHDRTNRYTFVLDMTNRFVQHAIGNG